MKFWLGNKLDGEFDMPVAEVAAKFKDWYHLKSAHYRMGVRLERALRDFLTDPEGFNSSWINEHGPDSFDELFDLVYDSIYGTSRVKS